MRVSPQEEFDLHSQHRRFLIEADQLFTMLRQLAASMPSELTSLTDTSFISDLPTWTVHHENPPDHILNNCVQCTVSDEI